jgi:hypothetical protein
VKVRERLGGLRADLISVTGVKRQGLYLFTIDWSHQDKNMVDTGFSETPEHKCGHVFKMDNGNYFIYPNNRIIWRHQSQTPSSDLKIPYFKFSTRKWFCENQDRWSASGATNFNYDTNTDEEY